MARPNKGLGHVDGLKGDPENKWRLKVVLSTITEDLFVDEACEELAIGPTQFANLRRQVLQGFLDLDRIYLTDELSRRWEMRARANLERSLARP